MTETMYDVRGNVYEIIGERTNGNKTIDLTYRELKERFRQINRECGNETKRDENKIKGYIVFSADSFEQPYTEEERTYVVTSNNKAFRDCMGGYSIFGSSLAGDDNHVRLEQYMADEYGGKDGWKIERCYIEECSIERDKAIAKKLKNMEEEL